MTVQEEILKKVKRVLRNHPEGPKFFDALDGEIIGKASDKVILALFDLIPDKHFLVLSGGFGLKIADRMDNLELPRLPYVLFRGGIRSGAEPTIIRQTDLGEFTEGIFLDDSIYGGATYYAIQKTFQNNTKLEKCAVIYDGCPIEKSDIKSLFRYYDYFKATPNYKF